MIDVHGSYFSFVIWAVFVTDIIKKKNNSVRTDLLLHYVSATLSFGIGLSLNVMYNCIVVQQ